MIWFASGISTPYLGSHDDTSAILPVPCQWIYSMDLALELNSVIADLCKGLTSTAHPFFIRFVALPSNLVFELVIVGYVLVGTNGAYKKSNA